MCACRRDSVPLALRFTCVCKQCLEFHSNFVVFSAFSVSFDGKTFPSTSATAIRKASPPGLPLISALAAATAADEQATSRDAVPNEPGTTCVTVADLALTGTMAETAISPHRGGGVGSLPRPSPAVTAAAAISSALPTTLAAAAAVRSVAGGNEEVVSLASALSSMVMVQLQQQFATQQAHITASLQQMQAKTEQEMSEMRASFEQRLTTLQEQQQSRTTSELEQHQQQQQQKHQVYESKQQRKEQRLARRQFKALRTKIETMSEAMPPITYQQQQQPQQQSWVRPSKQHLQFGSALSASSAATSGVEAASSTAWLADSRMLSGPPLGLRAFSVRFSQQAHARNVSVSADSQSAKCTFALDTST